MLSCFDLACSHNHAPILSLFTVSMWQSVLLPAPLSKGKDASKHASMRQWCRNNNSTACNFLKFLSKDHCLTVACKNKSNENQKLVRTTTLTGQVVLKSKHPLLWLFIVCSCVGLLCVALKHGLHPLAMTKLGGTLTVVKILQCKMTSYWIKAPTLAIHTIFLIKVSEIAQNIVSSVSRYRCSYTQHCQEVNCFTGKQQGMLGWERK